jgi:hypothetical protein
LCKCDCDGNEREYTGKTLKNGDTKSCGCYSREVFKINSYEVTKKYNTYEILETYGVGFDSQNNKFYFDLEDYEKVKGNYWFKDDYSGGYFYYWNFDKKGKIALHTYLLNNPEGTVIDHINRNRTDNRRENLRVVSQSINSKNSKIHKNNSSGCSGVNWNKELGKWRVRIGLDFSRI